MKAIIDRNSKKPSLYYTAGKFITIAGLGEFPSLLQCGMKDYTYQYWSVLSVTFSLTELLEMVLYGEIETENQNMFQLAAITADFVYYIDENDSDETESTIMLNRNMELVSDNWLAYNDLVGTVEKNEGLLWISGSVKYWQREQYVRPELITPEIKDALEAVEVDKLSDEEKSIYMAYLNNGPVEYTKPECLMAVLSNDVDQDNYSYQLAVIVKMLED